MHAAPARYVSVSELYSADEVELLLEEIRELEPTSCRGEDVQDFEIAGSGLGGLGGGAGAGGRSPCGTELTERSWDSHAHYSRAPPPRPRHVAPLYCRARHLVTLQGATALIIFLCSVSLCGCVWSLVGVRSWLLPLSSRVRLLLLGGVTSALLHFALLFVHVTRLAALLPVNWRLVAVCACLWSSCSLLAGGSMTAHAVLLAPEYRHAPAHVTALLLSAAGLGVCGALAAGAVVGVSFRACYAAHAAAARAEGASSPPPAGGGGGGGAYRAVPSAPPAGEPPPERSPPQPSTSRQNPL